jgi:hypothetical protein
MLEWPPRHPPRAMLHPLPTLPESIFWSAPLERDTEFTAEDPLALDYLGQQIGNWLFPGFTTRTGRAQYYLVVLYGLHLVDRAVKEYRYSGDDDTRTKLFERWERFWALAAFESREGVIGRGDVDAMRGVRGARRAWVRGSKPLLLDFTLISRQSELAGFGAYLSSLRHHRLVIDHTLRPSGAASELIDRFWSEADTHSRSHLYERYALSALDRRQSSIPRKSGAVTLARAGHKTRLSAIRRDGRQATRERLWRILFEGARDPTTLPLALQLEAAGRQDVYDGAELLAGMLGGRWGALGSPQRELVDLAQAFGELAVSLLDHFDRIYERIDAAGWIADAGTVARAVFSRPETRTLRSRCARLREHPLRRRLGELRFHARPLLKLADQLTHTDPMICLEALLTYHREVQSSRRGGGSWIRHEPPKLTLQVTHYRGYANEAQFPNFKLGTMQRLLRDLGRFP